MARALVLPLAGLLVAAVLLRALRPSPALPPPAEPVALEPTPAAPEAAPAPPPLPEAAPPAPTAFAEPVLTAEELRPLLEARFSEETILAWARVTGRSFRASPDELATLRQAGMSDALLGRLRGEPEPPPAPEAAAVASSPPVTVYVPVSVTVVEAPPPPAPEPESVAPFVSTVVLACPLHGRAGCCPVPELPRPAIYGKPPFFKTHDFMPTKRLPGAEEVARREEARAARIRR